MLPYLIGKRTRLITERRVGQYHGGVQHAGFVQSVKTQVFHACNRSSNLLPRTTITLIRWRVRVLLRQSNYRFANTIPVFLSGGINQSGGRRIGRRSVTISRAFLFVRLGCPPKDLQLSRQSTVLKNQVSVVQLYLGPQNNLNFNLTSQIICIILQYEN